MMFEFHDCGFDFHNTGFGTFWTNELQQSDIFYFKRRFVVSDLRQGPLLLSTPPVPA